MSEIRFQVRRHNFNSAEARRLVAGLDKDIADVYSDYDPAENLQPGVSAATIPAAQQDIEYSQATNEAAFEDEAIIGLKEGLFFFVAFVETTAGEVPAGCAALRLLTSIPSLPLFSPSNVPPELPQGLTYAELKRFYVSPIYRGNGIARALLKQVESFAQRELKLDVVALEVGYRQNAAVKLYKKLGYVQRPMYGDHVGMEPEAGGDSLCMEKLLSKSKH